MRAGALDDHRDFCAVAIAEGRLRSAGRIQTRPEALELFAQSLDERDWVASEVTGNAWAIARILEAHVARVIVVSPNDTGFRQARAAPALCGARGSSRTATIRTSAPGYSWTSTAPTGPDPTTEPSSATPSLVRKRIARAGVSGDPQRSAGAGSGAARCGSRVMVRPASTARNGHDDHADQTRLTSPTRGEG